MAKEREIRFPKNDEERAYCMRRLLEERAKYDFPEGMRISFHQFQNAPKNTGVLMVHVNIGPGSFAEPQPIIYGVVTRNGSPLCALQNIPTSSPGAYVFTRELDGAKEK